MIFQCAWRTGRPCQRVLFRGCYEVWEFFTKKKINYPNLKRFTGAHKWFVGLGGKIKKITSNYVLHPQVEWKNVPIIILLEQALVAAQASIGLRNCQLSVFA